MRSILTLLMLSGFCFSPAQIDLEVWPGDANADSIVSVRDLLAVGIAYGSEVIPRSDISEAWAPMPAQGIDGQVLPVTGVNFAHINSSGDFLIDTADIDAIALNYDSTILVNQQIPFSGQWFPEEPAPVSYCIRLGIFFEQDTVFVGDTILADIVLDFEPGPPLDPLDGFLGLAFTLRYDPINVEDELTRAFPVPLSGDLMTVTATFAEANAFKALPSGRIDYGAAGRGVNALTQPRQLGQLQFIVVEELIIRQEIETTPFTIEFVPESLIAVNNQEQFISFCPTEPAKIVLAQDVNAVKEPGRVGQLAVFPNPAIQTVNIKSPLPLSWLSLTDVQGRVFWRRGFSTPTSYHQMDLSSLPAGLYILQGLSEEGQILREKLMLRP